MRPLALFLVLLAAVAGLSSAAETLVVPYGQVWNFLNPMGTNPKNTDPDFDTTWWLPEEEFQLDYKNQTGHRTAETFDQIDYRLRSAPGRQQVVSDEHAMTIADHVAMNFKRVLAVFQIVRD